MKHVDDFIDDPTSDRYAACGHLEYHCPASGCNHIEVTVEGPNGETED